MPLILDPSLSSSTPPSISSLSSSQPKPIRQPRSPRTRKLTSPPVQSEQAALDYLGLHVANDPILMGMLAELQNRGVSTGEVLRPLIPPKVGSKRAGVVGLNGGLEGRPNPGYSAARDTLVGFAKQVIPTYEPGRMHYLLGNTLERAYRTATNTLREGEKPVRRLVITTPPQHGKSELASRVFPAWALGQNPNLNLIMASYTSDLAGMNSAVAKGYVQSSAFAALFPDVKLRRGSNRTDLWKISEYRGGLRAAGVGGGLTGFPANIFIIDDPVKGREDADSPLMRDMVWNWYKSVARTRLQGDAGVMIIIMTRWHKEDLVGKLLSLQDTDPKADKWEVLHLKALAEEQDPEDPFSLPDPLGREVDEPLWPERFSQDYYYNVRANSESDWECLWQGTPKPQAGAMFERKNFKMLKREEVPPFIPDVFDQYGKNVTRFPHGWKEDQERLVRTCRYWDLAVSAKDSACYTVGVLVAVSSVGNIYIMDVVRFREEWPTAKKKIKQQILDDGTNVTVGMEGVAFQSAAVQEFRADPDLIAFTIRSTVPKVDKKARATPWATRAEAGKVFVCVGKWNQEFFSEVESFPTGKYLDQVDSVSGAVEVLGIIGGYVVTSGVSETKTPDKVLSNETPTFEESPFDRILQATGAVRGGEAGRSGGVMGNGFKPLMGKPEENPIPGALQALETYRLVRLPLPPGSPVGLYRTALMTLPAQERELYYEAIPGLKIDENNLVLTLDSK